MYIASSAAVYPEATIVFGYMEQASVLRWHMRLQAPRCHGYQQWSVYSCLEAFVTKQTWGAYRAGMVDALQYRVRGPREFFVRVEL